MAVVERRFELQTILGRGAFGTVYKAGLHGVNGFYKVVALKLLHPDLADDPEVTRRLRDEARLLGLVHHRAIVSVDALIRLDDRWTVVMEYVDGVSLRRLLQEGPLPMGVTLELLTEVANALHAAFTQPGPDGRPLGLLHRDIKPSNLQLTGAGEVKLLDFGIARADYQARESDTRSELLGSLGYMAPERLAGRGGAPSDVYALGVVAWEMLMGKRLGKTCLSPRGHQRFLAGAMEEARCSLGRRYQQVLDLVEGMLAFEDQKRPTAKDVERRCRLLRSQIGGPWLKDWTEERVPPSRDASRFERCEGQGATPESSTGPAAASPPRPARWAGMAAGVVLGLGLAALGASASATALQLAVAEEPGTKVEEALRAAASAGMGEAPEEGLPADP